jgi:ribonucleotide monophosphatase NagD (HAD superfamily)
MYKSVYCFCIISGVLWLNNTPLEGSVEVINRLKELGKKVFLVTNNCNSTVNQYMNKTNAFGLHVAEVGQLYRLIFVLVLEKENLLKELHFLYLSPYETTWN